MNKFKIEIELKSDTTFGSGESRNGVVNTEVLTDEKGYPYFLGKTFKGSLKEAFSTLVFPSCSEKERKIINGFFGESGYSSLDEKSGNLIFGNFQLDQDEIFAYEKFFNERNDKSEDFNRDKKKILLKQLMDIEFSTKIGDDSIAEDKSLRATRVLKKGLKFYGYIEVKEELDSDTEELLKLGLDSLKHLGTKKSRGKGLVNVSIVKDSFNKKELKDNFNIDYKKDFLLYKIKLVEPIKVGSSRSKYDYEETKSYISGTVARGGIISNYLQNSSSENISNILESVYFHNIYPMYGDEYSLPTANIFQVDKQDMKNSPKILISEKESTIDGVKFSDYFSYIEGNSSRDKKNRIQKLNGGEFFFYKDETIKMFNVKKNYQFHHSKEKSTENIFRYESIEKDQIFYGIIEFPNENSNAKEDILSAFKKNNTLYLGGSRTSGYGKCEIISAKSIKKEELPYMKIGCRIENNLENYIYFLSDAIIIDEKGQITTNLKLDGIDNNKVCPSIEITEISGFNGKWASTIPTETAIKMGSVIKYKGELLDTSKFKNYICRKSEGFGQFIFNPEFLFAKQIEILSENSTYDGLNDLVENKERVTIKYNDIKDQLEELFDEIVEDKIIGKVFDWEIKDREKNNNDKTLISKSQINNIITLMDIGIFEEDFSKMKSDIKNYLEKTSRNLGKNKQKNEFLDKKIFMLEGTEFRNFINFNNSVIDGNDTINLSKNEIEYIKNQFYSNNGKLNKKSVKFIRKALYFQMKAMKGDN